MQEIVLVLGSVAGACTAVAIDRLPKRKNGRLIFKTNPVIKNQIQSLRIEKDVLTRTISRLYQQESELSRIQRDKLLLRYQNQLGLVIAKIEKLEAASKHPDLGPVADGLITLMDQKFSQLDQRLNEISSKIAVSTITPPQIKHIEAPKEINLEKHEVKKAETKNEIQKIKEEYSPAPPVELPSTEPHKLVELITLTEIPSKIPEFPTELITPVTTRSKPIIEIPKSESPPPTYEKNIQIPVPVKMPEDEKLEDDDKDIDKLKSEIMKALSKLEQVEVE